MGPGRPSLGPHDFAPQRHRGGDTGIRPHPGVAKHVFVKRTEKLPAEHPARSCPDAAPKLSKTSRTNASGAQLRANVNQSWPSWSILGPKLDHIAYISTSVDAIWPKCGLNLAQIRRCLSDVCPNWPKPGRGRQKMANCWQRSAEFGKCWLNLAEVWPVLTNVGLQWQTSAICRRVCAESGLPRQPSDKCRATAGLAGFALGIFPGRAASNLSTTLG